MMSSGHHVVAARLLLLAAVFSTVMSYSVLPGESGTSSLRYWQPIYDREYIDEVPNEFDGRIKRGLDDIEQQLSKRTNLKRLVILSARGFGRK